MILFYNIFSFAAFFSSTSVGTKLQLAPVTETILYTTFGEIEICLCETDRCGINGDPLRQLHPRSIKRARVCLLSRYDKQIPGRWLHDVSRIFRIWIRVTRVQKERIHSTGECVGKNAIEIFNFAADQPDPAKSSIVSQRCGKARFDRLRPAHWRGVMDPRYDFDRLELASN